MRLHTSICTLMGILAGFTGWTQNAAAIQLTNPSFEDVPRHSHVPRGWYDCGFPGESAPDTQPDPTFRVSKAAQDGDTYVGLVVRDNDTWEAISQKLPKALEKGKCYEFSLFLSRSESYVSVSRVTETEANYNTPAKIRIWGGFDYCDKQYLLAETKLVINTRWIEYKMKLEPIANYTHIVIQAFFKTPTLFPYNGNVLMDKASDLVVIPCDQPIVENEEPEEKAVVKSPPKAEVKKPAATPTPKPTPKPAEKKEEIKPKDVLENVKISEISRSELKEGSKIRIDNLYFETDKAIIISSSFGVLDELFTFLAKNPDVSVEIGGHTNGLASDDYADKLSTNRAKAIFDYLIKKGIEKERLTYKGYGKRNQIATNSTLEGRKKNQRVEVKILSING